jgi:hypothetical protein
VIIVTPRVPSITFTVEKKMQITILEIILAVSPLQSLSKTHKKGKKRDSRREVQNISPTNSHFWEDWKVLLIVLYCSGNNYAWE